MPDDEILTVKTLLATGLQCRCPHCRERVPLELDDGIRGAQFECRRCGGMLKIDSNAEIQIP